LTRPEEHARQSFDEHEESDRECWWRFGAASDQNSQPFIRVGSAHRAYRMTSPDQLLDLIVPKIPSPTRRYGVVADGLGMRNVC
jgi:hypothetical protein